MSEPKVVTLEMAEVEFDRFVEAMQLELNPDKMNEKDRESFESARDRLVAAIERGALVVNDEGEAIFTPENRKSIYQNAITFHERTGASLTASDSKKEGHNAAKMYAMLGDMCRVPPKVFAGLVGRDIKICEALFVLLMG